MKSSKSKDKAGLPGKNIRIRKQAAAFQSSAKKRTVDDRLDEKIKAERDRAQQYLDIARTILVALDNKGRVTLLNKRGCEALGVKEKDLIGKSWFDEVVPVEQRMQTKAAFNQIIEGTIRPYEYYENLLVTKKGKIRLFAWNNIHLKNEAGQIIGTLSSGEDITERRRAEDELRRSEEQFRTLIETMNDGLLMVGENMEITYVNKRLAELLGYSTESLPGRSVLEFLADENRKVVEEQWAKRKIGESRPYEIEWVREDGQKVFTIISPRPLVDAKGSFRGSFAVVTDISDRKEAEILNKAKTWLVESLRKTANISDCLKYGCRAIHEARLFKNILCVLNDDHTITNIEFLGLKKKDLPRIKNQLPLNLDAQLKDSLKLYCIGSSYLIPQDISLNLRILSDGSTGDRKILKHPVSKADGDKLLVPMHDNLVDYKGWLLAGSTYPGIKIDSAIVSFVEEVAEIVAKKINEIQYLERLHTEQKHLREKNVALREVLTHIEEEKLQIKQRIGEIIDKSLLPTLTRLVNSDGTINRSYYDYLVNSMKELVRSSGGQRQIYSKLSPREVEICNLIKGGSSSKEIAEALHLSIATIQKHRERIRSKLGLANKNVNLTSYLKNPQLKNT